MDNQKIQKAIQLLDSDIHALTSEFNQLKKQHAKQRALFGFFVAASAVAWGVNYLKEQEPKAVVPKP
jgi:hypothetical protein